MALNFDIEAARKALNDVNALWGAFTWCNTAQGTQFWESESRKKTLSPEAREIVKKMIAEHEAKEAPTMTAFEPGKEYKTRDGRKVRIYAVDGGGEYPIHGVYFNGNKWQLTSWTRDGRISLTMCDSFADIMPPEPEKVTVWLNIYPDGQIQNHRSRENANRNATSDRIACVPLTYFKGEGLE